MNKYLLILFLLVVIYCIGDLVVHFDRGSRWIVWPTVSILQFILITLIYIFNTGHFMKRKILLFSIPFFLIYAVLYIFILQDISHLFPNLMTISLFAFLIISISLFIEIYNNVEHENLFLYPFFWINIAVLIYFSGNLFMTLSYNIFTMEKVFELYIPLHGTLNTVKNLLFAMAFIVNLYNLRKASMS